VRTAARHTELARMLLIASFIFLIIIVVFIQHSCDLFLKGQVGAKGMKTLSPTVTQQKLEHNHANCLAGENNYMLFHSSYVQTSLSVAENLAIIIYNLLNDVHKLIEND
jgi:hypothetical protein